MENKNSLGIDENVENVDIVFDTSSGFSITEQQEILDKINSLSVEKSLVPQEGLFQNEAKKRGLWFPLVVNGAALLCLVLGFLLLRSFQSRDDQDIREGSGLLDLTERTLIQEIRHETSRLLTEKEKEINDILALLAEAGAEYSQLQLSVNTLTENQKARSEYLFNLQDEYQDILSQLQEERARILEDSRLREIALRAQAEERARTANSSGAANSSDAFSVRVEQSEASLRRAMEELSRLSGEQERAAAAEAQLRGYYVLVNERIKTGELSEAANSLQGMREFLNAPLFYSTRSMEARRLVHLAAISVMEDALNEAMALETGIPRTVLVPTENPAEIENATAPLLAKISELEQANQDQERIIAVLNSQDSSRSQLIAEYNNRISNLQGQLTSAQTQAANQQTQISSLQGQLTSSQAQAANQQSQISSLQGQLTSSQAQAGNQQTQISNLQLQITNYQTQVSSQQQTINQRDSTIQGLRDQNTAQEQRLTQLTRSTENLQRQLDSIPQVVARTIEDPAIQDLLGPVARQALVQEIQQAIRLAIQ